MILLLVLPPLALIAWLAWDTWLQHERDMKFMDTLKRDKEDDEP